MTKTPSAGEPYFRASTGSETVDAVSMIPITGNVVHPRWYKTVLTESGKPDCIAILLLADIVYWYRRYEVRDEATGQFLGYRKRIKGQFLQRSYSQIEELMGLSRDQARRAIKRLEDLGLIERRMENVDLGSRRLGTRMFLVLDPERLMEVTYPEHVREQRRFVENFPIVENQGAGFPQTCGYVENDDFYVFENGEDTSNIGDEQDVHAIGEGGGKNHTPPVIPDSSTGVSTVHLSGGWQKSHPPGWQKSHPPNKVTKNTNTKTTYQLGSGKPGPPTAGWPERPAADGPSIIFDEPAKDDLLGSNAPARAVRGPVSPSIRMVDALSLEDAYNALKAASFNRCGLRDDSDHNRALKSISDLLDDGFDLASIISSWDIRQSEQISSGSTPSAFPVLSAWLDDKGPHGARALCRSRASPV